MIHEPPLLFLQAGVRFISYDKFKSKLRDSEVGILPASDASLTVRPLADSLFQRFQINSGKT